MAVCEVIGRVLTSSSTIRSVDLSDCMLVSKGLGKILEALRQGSNIISLNLKGNNINGPIVSQLGDILQHNNTIKHIFIEWNNLGSDKESFENFCKGLCVNHNIEELDLRYNQISHDCAEALSAVLIKNKSLNIINLAWNNLGVEGGQFILSGMRENSSIIKLNLRGNCIPDQIIEAIEDCAYKNQSKRINSAVNISKSIESAKVNVIYKNNQEKLFTSADAIGETSSVIKRRKRRKFRSLGCFGEVSNDLINLQSSSESDCLDSIKSLKIIEDKQSTKHQSINFLPSINGNNNTENNDLNTKILELNNILQERTTAITNLTSEITDKNTEIEAAKMAIESLQIELNELKNNKQEFIAAQIKEIDKIKEEQRVSEENFNKMYKELEDTHAGVFQKNIEWESKAHRYERDIHKSSLEIVSLREKWLNKSQLYEDMIIKCKTEIHRLKRESKEKENRHKVELNVLKNSLKETTHALEECQAQLQKTRGELRETSTNLSNVKSRLGEMEYINSKYNRLDESLQKIKEDKSSVEDKFVDSQRTIASLKRQVSALQGELIEPQRRYDLLKNELEQEQQKSVRLKEELFEDRTRIKEQDNNIQKLNQQITGLNSQINEIQKSYTEEIRERDKEKKQLKEIIANKERDFNELK